RPASSRRCGCRGSRGARPPSRGPAAAPGRRARRSSRTAEQWPPSAADPTLRGVPPAYDEFSMFQDNPTEVGLPWSGPPKVRRESVDVGGGQKVSALVWGSASPEIVLVHGGGQNAHTWDTVALALNRPLVAIDLPGHGHSDWREDHDYGPVTSAPAVATA